MPISAQALLSGIALLILGALGGVLTFHAVPQENRELLSTIEGAIAGALMMGGANKLADRLSAPNATVNTGDAP